MLSRLCPRKPWWPEVDNDEVTIVAEEAPQEMVGVARGRHNGREGPRRPGCRHHHDELTLLQLYTSTHQFACLFRHPGENGDMQVSKRANNS